MTILSRNQQIKKNILVTNQELNPLHLNISDEDYEKLRQVYYPVRNRIQNFFVHYCSDDFQTVNVQVLNELVRVGALAVGYMGSVFASEQDLHDRRDYVFNLAYPASYEQMLSLIGEIGKGQLEFLCRYPMHEIGGITILDTIKPFL